MAQDHTLLTSRFELKYLIPQRVALQVRDFVRSYLEPDEYASKDGDFSYPVHSVYVDSPDWLIHARTLNGDKNRYKLRIRFYNDSDKTPVFWEIKRRMKDVIIKQRCGIRRQCAARVMAGQLPKREEMSFPDDPEQLGAIQEFFRLQYSLNAGPAVHVAYEREAYVLPHNNEFRVTLDRHVRARRQLDCELSTRWEWPIICTGTGAHPEDVVILELKFNERFPEWYRELVSRFNLPQCGAAKYAESTTIHHGRDLHPRDVVRNLLL